MSGYYKDDKSTEKSFTPEGWLRTGDLVELDAQGRVKITSRISEIFKNQSGEFIAPTPIEKRFATNDMIDQLCLVGRGLPSNLLFVTLNGNYQKTKKLEIKKSLKDSLHESNSRLAKFEKISHVVVVKDSWTPNNNMLTPTLKVKRRAIEEHYEGLIQKVLKDHQPIVWE